jgi:hypothetical protein
MVMVEKKGGRDNLYNRISILGKEYIGGKFYPRELMLTLNIAF